MRIAASKPLRLDLPVLFPLSFCISPNVHTSAGYRLSSDSAMSCTSLEDNTVTGMEAERERDGHQVINALLAAGVT